MALLASHIRCRLVASDEPFVEYDARADHLRHRMGISLLRGFKIVQAISSDA
jgi:hypothetical protein